MTKVKVIQGQTTTDTDNDDIINALSDCLTSNHRNVSTRVCP